MYRSILSRLFTLWAVAGLAFATLLALPAAVVQADEEEQTLFRTEFSDVSSGPLVNPVDLDYGTVTPDGGSVAIATVNGQKALVLDGTGGQASALLQWTNFPGELPGVPPPAVQVRIDAKFTASSTTSEGASFGFLTGTTFFEIFSFGANGRLTRGGNAIGLSYTADSVVKLEGRVLLSSGSSSGKLQIKLESSSGQTTLVIDLDPAFTAATLNQLRFRTPSGSGKYSIDDIKVEFKQGEPEDDDPPAVIIIRDGDIERELEIINGIIFVNIKISIMNSGGKARGSFLIIDLDDLDDLDLAEVGFLAGEGFVREIRDGKLYIGVGYNNIIRNDLIKIKVKFKVKNGRTNIKIDIKCRLSYRDTAGRQELVIAPIPIFIPVIVPSNGTIPIVGTNPISSTNPISGTTPISGTLPVIDVTRLPVTEIDIRFRLSWQGRGGIAIFGLPISAPITRSDGLIIQYFERARLEYHARFRGTPDEVQLGLLAVELGYAVPPTSTTAPTSTTELRWYYPATGHSIAQPFRGYWQSRGGIAIFGLPISPVRSENGIMVQYFERARLELHPELRGTPYEVQLGLLGVNAYVREREDDD